MTTPDWLDEVAPRIAKETKLFGSYDARQPLKDFARALYAEIRARDKTGFDALVATNWPALITAQDAYAAGAASAQAREWQPISTAPKDGTFLVACIANDRIYWAQAARRGDRALSSVFFTPTGMGVSGQTHWQPLPPPPALNKEQGAREMKTVLVWYLVTFGPNSPVVVSWSPPMATSVECERVRDVLVNSSFGVHGRCIQMNVMEQGK